MLSNQPVMFDYMLQSSLSLITIASISVHYIIIWHYMIQEPQYLHTIMTDFQAC